MVRNAGWRILSLLIVLVMSVAFSAIAETNASSLTDLEKQMRKDFNRYTYMEFLEACDEQMGRDFARDKAVEYYSIYPDSPDIAWGVMIYCNPFSEPERIIEAGTTILLDCDLPAYTEDMLKKPHESVVLHCTSVYINFVYAYYQLDDEEKLVSAGDWVLSYAGYNEEQFISALSAGDYVTGYFTQNNNEEKALYYARQVESLLSKYGDQYPTIVKKFMPEYKITFVPILEKYAQVRGNK